MEDWEKGGGGREGRRESRDTENTSKSEEGRMVDREQEREKIQTRVADVSPHHYISFLGNITSRDGLCRYI